jgi:hypothetical protein
MFEICGDESIALYLNPPLGKVEPKSRRKSGAKIYQKVEEKSGAKTLKKIQKIINNKTKY